MPETTWPLLVAREDGEGGLLAPLFLHSVCGTPDAEIERNIRYSLSRNYKRFNEQLRDDPIGRPASIVGSAPSLAQDYGNLVGDVFAINQAHDYLIGKGVVPRYGVLWDAGKVLGGFIEPRSGVTYLIGSRCDPSVIDKFLLHDTIVWHAMGDECLQPLLEEHGVVEPMMGGGASGVTRLMFVAYTMGYRDLHLFGADASCDEDAHVVPNPEAQRYIDINCMGKWYRTTPQLASQVEDFKVLAPMLKEVGATLTVHGRGLLPDVARSLGYNTQPLEEH